MGSGEYRHVCLIVHVVVSVTLHTVGVVTKGRVVQEALTSSTLTHPAYGKDVRRT